MNYSNPCGCTLRHRILSSRAGGAICFLAIVFFLAVGLILGAVYAETLLPALAALIVFAAVILAVIIALVIALSRRTE